MDSIHVVVIVVLPIHWDPQQLILLLLQDVRVHVTHIIMVHVLHRTRMVAMVLLVLLILLLLQRRMGHVIVCAQQDSVTLHHPKVLYRLFQVPARALIVNQYVVQLIPIVLHILTMLIVVVLVTVV
jgi:hypothetical protein